MKYYWNCICKTCNQECTIRRCRLFQNKAKKCSECYKNKDGMLNRIKQKALARQGLYLSGEYINDCSELTFQCSEDHIWVAKARSILSDKWCRVCADKIVTDFKEVLLLGILRGGECISSEEDFRGMKKNLQWNCANGHTWFAPPTRIKVGSWCPKCKERLNEGYLRSILELGFNKPFPKIRPKWLRNKEGNLIELDGYNEELNLAFEYQGKQHFEKVEFFHKRNTLSKIKSNDKFKFAELSKRGIKLLIVDYKSLTADFPSIVKTFCEQNDIFGFNFNDNIEVVNYIDRLKPYIEIAESKEGQILTKSWLGARSKLKVKCKNNHIWDTRPDNLMSGIWCQECKRLNKNNAKRNKGAQ